MMMRADESYTPAEGCTAEELLACTVADDIDACMAACNGEEPEEEEPWYQENKSGTLTAKISSDTPNAEVPANIERVPFLTFTLNADEDITLYSATFEFEWYGNPNNLVNFSIYNSNNVKVSKEKTTMTNWKVTISFLSNTVIKAKETLTVVAKISAGDNSTYGLRLTAINASAETIKGLPVVGNSMKNVWVMNMWELDFVSLSGSTESPVKIWEDALLAKFKLSNTWKVEDVLVKSITIDVNTNKWEFENLSLYANDEEIASNLKVNSKQIVANVDYTIAKNTKNVEFELRGSATEMANGISFTMDKDAILANGSKYWFTTAVNWLANDTAVSKSLNIEGSDITVSFTKSDIDEAKKWTAWVYVWTLKFTSNWNYNIEKLYVNATADTWIIDDIRLWDMSDDGYVAGKWYEFKDIDLVAGNTLSLPLVFDVNENANNGSGVNFLITLTTATFEDTDNDTTYTYGGSNKLEDIVSTVDPLSTAKTITVSAASLDVKVMTLTNRTIALWWDDYELAYKARLDAGDAGDVEISKIVFTNIWEMTNTANNTTGTDLWNVVSSVKLELNWTEYTSSKISANTVTFSNLKNTIDAGSTNVDLKVSVQTKSVTNYTWTIELKINAASDIVAKDGSDDVVPTIIPWIQTVLTLATAWTLTATFDTTENTSTTMNNFTKQPKFALAWAEDSVLLAKVKLVAAVEDIRITDVVLTWDDAWTFESSLDSISLVYGDQTIAGKTVNAGGKTVVTFDKLTSKKLDVSSDTPSYAEIRATFKAINAKSAEGGATDGANLTWILVGFTAKWISSQNDLTAVVPAASTNWITVVANTIDSITLAPAAALEAGEDVLVWTLTVKPTTQNWNIDAAWDVINAVLSAITLTWTSTALSGSTPTLYIGRAEWTGKADGSTLTSADWLKIDWEEAVFNIYADKVEIKDTATKDASLTIKINDITTDVVFGNVRKLLPTGATKSISVKVSE